MRLSCGHVSLVAWFLVVGQAFSHGDVEERIAALTSEIAAAPGDVTILLERADLYRQHQDWTAALADYENAARLKPDLDTGLLCGRVLLESGHAPGSLVVLNGYLRRHPDHPQALVWRARVLGKLGRQAEALADYQNALEKTGAPEPDLVVESADALAAHGRKEDAVRILEAGVEKLGAIPTLVLRLIDLEIATNDFSAALVRVEVMRRSAPRPEPWMARRASILAQQGLVRESRAAWRELMIHLAALPDAERHSHAMSTLAEESRQALTSLSSQPEISPTPSPP